jgi:RNA polymerase-binding transcription factor DksA
VDAAVDDAQVRAHLSADRADTLARIAGLQRDFDAVVDAATGGAVDDEHDPEGATLAFERARTAALIDQARGHLADIQHALDRLAAGNYATCARCGGPIGSARLEARPVARTCITCA